MQLSHSFLDTLSSNDAALSLERPCVTSGWLGLVSISVLVQLGPVSLRVVVYLFSSLFKWDLHLTFVPYTCMSYILTPEHLVRGRDTEQLFL